MIYGKLHSDITLNVHDKLTQIVLNPVKLSTRTSTLGGVKGIVRARVFIGIRIRVSREMDNRIKSIIPK